MAIKPNTLNHQERDLRLEDRQSGNGEEPAKALLTLRARIDRAKQAATIRQAKTLLANRNKCECFEKGWLAALGEIEQGGL